MLKRKYVIGICLGLVFTLACFFLRAEKVIINDGNMVPLTAELPQMDEDMACVSGETESTLNIKQEIDPLSELEMSSKTEKIVLQDDITLEAKTVVRENEIIEMDYDELMVTVAKQDITGEGYICWKNWKDVRNNGLVDGNIYIPLLGDSVYTSMKLPGDVQTFMEYRVNPGIVAYRPKGFNRTVGIGAVYQSTGFELPDEFNVCIGRFMVFMLKDTHDSQWEILDVKEPLDKIEYLQLRKLPWSLREYYRPSEKTVFHENYVEIKLKKEDLDMGVLHFYGQKLPCISDETVGIVTIFEVWSDTEGIDGKLACEIGADYWSASGECLQAFFGRNYALTNEHKIMIGHNMPDEVYEQLVAIGKSPSVCLDMFMEYDRAE